MPKPRVPSPLPSEGSDPPPASGPGEPAAPLGLRLVGEAGRPLSKAQKKFDRLLRKVETLRAEKIRVTARCDRFLKLYRDRIHPEEQRMHTRRREVVLLLAAAWRAPKGLGARQREELEDFLANQLQELLAADPGALDEELKQLWAELHPPERDEGPEPDAADEAGPPGGKGPGIPPEIAELIRDLGLDPEGFKPGMSHAEALAEAKRQLGGAFDASGPGSEGGAGANPASRAKTARAQAAELKAAERAAAREEARKRTVVSIYKQLAKVLHPDLERDPALRERKHTLMQDLTKAYREGDLHTLLRLELEWISREEGDLARLGDEKLDIYIELLEEQVGELQAEVRDLPFSPRFAVVGRFAHPVYGVPADIDGILRGIREASTSLKLFRDALRGPQAREELREVLRQLGLQRKRQARWDAFEAGF
jgi:hypothetical protein